MKTLTEKRVLNYTTFLVVVLAVIIANTVLLETGIGIDLLIRILLVAAFYFANRKLIDVFLKDRGDLPKT